MAFMRTNAVDIEVGGKIYNSLDDFGLAIGNTDYLGSPVQDDSNLVFVPGKSKPLNFDDYIFGAPSFSYRSINIEFGGIREKDRWDETISHFRNLFEGKEIKLRFLTDPDWYWEGRAKIDDFKHNGQLGRFTLQVPYADAYKYRDRAFNIKSTASGVTVLLDNTLKRVIPKITTNAEISIAFGSTTVSMSKGTWLNAALILEPGRNEMKFTGKADITVEYKEGSL